MNLSQAPLLPKVMTGFLLALLAIILAMQGARADASVFEWWNALPTDPQLSSDGLSMSGAMHHPVLLLLDPNPPRDRLSVPPRDYLVQPQTATANFQFSYIPNGQTDLFGEPCYAFPQAARSAVERAGVIWGNILRSSVPITVRLCWMNRATNVLGYSGGQPRHINFPNAPRSNTWFQGSLANSLAGSDLDPNNFDMHIAMNGNFSWYLGLDAIPPSDQVDFVTVMLHEIAHGLNFVGSMQVASGQARWGYGTGSPNIYDVYMRDGSGNQLINTSVYPNPSSALLSAVTSDNLWFHGTNAMAANGGQRVRMYAPSTWSGGSSYSHLDYATFSAGLNRLMVYAIASGDAVHEPGAIAIGLLKDLYWQIGSAASYTLTVSSSGASGVAITANQPAYGGTTNYTRTGIPNGTSITLTAPATTAGSAIFSHWSGCNETFDMSCIVSMSSNKTVTAIYSMAPPASTSITTAVLPYARAVRVGELATAFATIINSGDQPAMDCLIALPEEISADLIYQTTDAQNLPIGEQDTPVDIPAGGQQGFVFGVRPLAPMAATEIALIFDCANSAPASSHAGLNTFILTAGEPPLPDLLAIGATPSNDGVVRLGGLDGISFFAAAAVDIGDAGTVEVSADDAGRGLPLTLRVCETDAAGQWLSCGPVLSREVAAGQTLYYTVVVTAIGQPIAFDPAVNRLFLRLTANGTTVGATNVAVTTGP